MRRIANIVRGGAGSSRGESDDSELADVLSWIDLGAPVGGEAFFDAAQPVVLARAPGRLDVMGGFADYSGSLVLEYPIRRSTWVAVQPCAQAALIIESTVGFEGAGRGANRVTIPMDKLTPASGPLDYEQARSLLTADGSRAWAAYVAGVLVVLHRERGSTLPAGVRVLIRSDVPSGLGLSSSAALVVAALDALAGLTHTELADRELALLAQKVENFVVGAPCGVMDQLTVTVGRADHLLEILCQPAEVRGHIRLPPELELWGLGSGIRHAVSGADYRSVRASAFMGYRMVMELAARDPATEAIADPRFGGYLANVTPAQWRARFRSRIPEQMDGQSFLDGYGPSIDNATAIEPARTYQIRACTEHPILEHERVRHFRDLLASGAPAESDRIALGTLMFASHASYSACGLGSEHTNILVDMVRALGPAGSFYGAKITGGGSGGTVAVLARGGSAGAIADLATRYHQETGQSCETVAGSSPGARLCPVRLLLPA